jgi:hypothetical protein
MTFKAHTSHNAIDGYELGSVDSTTKRLKKRRDQQRQQQSKPSAVVASTEVDLPRDVTATTITQDQLDLLWRDFDKAKRQLESEVRNCIPRL